MNRYRIDKQELLNTIRGWDSFLKRKVRLIACGGTALTLLGVKPSTKDIDLIVPDLSEYKYLISNLEELGYKPVTGSGWSRDEGFIFDFFKGKMVHTTELLESPLDNRNHVLKEKDVDLELLEKRFKETSSFDVSEDKVNKNLNHFLRIVKDERRNNG